MIKKIEMDEIILLRRSEEVDLTEKLSVVMPEVQDLIDTAAYNSNFANNSMGCLGLAGHQIGIQKRVIVVKIDDEWVLMVNPVIIPNKAAGQEGKKEPCLSRPKKAATYMKRFKKIRVQFNPVFKDIILRERKELTLKKMKARVVQHEVDHLNGVLI